MVWVHVRLAVLNENIFVNVPGDFLLSLRLILSWSSFSHIAAHDLLNDKLSEGIKLCQQLGDQVLSCLLHLRSTLVDLELLDVLERNLMSLLLEDLEVGEDFFKVAIGSLVAHHVQFLHLAEGLQFFFYFLVEEGGIFFFLDLNRWLLLFVAVFKTAEFFEQAIVISRPSVELELLHILGLIRSLGLGLSLHLIEQVGKLVVSEDLLFVSKATFGTLLELSVKLTVVLFNLGADCVRLLQFVLVEFLAVT